MKLSHLTLTGADDRTDPLELARLSRRHPLIEWGLLVDPAQEGKPRFPTRDWRARFARQAPHARRTAHLCGRTTIDVLDWRTHDVRSRVDDLVGLPVDRLQLNFEAEHIMTLDIPGWTANWFDHAHDDLRVITQHNEANAAINRVFHHAGGANYQTLFDRSGGNGVLPSQWPPLVDGVACGYAGGLNAENLEQQLAAIADVAGDATIWLDMETGLRSDERFDLERVQAVIDALMRHTGATSLHPGVAA